MITKGLSVVLTDFEGTNQFKEVSCQGQRLESTTREQGIHFLELRMDGWTLSITSLINGPPSCRSAAGNYVTGSTTPSNTSGQFTG